VAARGRLAGRVVSAHRCSGPGYPPGGVVCLCVRGQDHDEGLFDVPVGEES
jgi:hypothetical protein